MLSLDGVQLPNCMKPTHCFTKDAFVQAQARVRPPDAIVGTQEAIAQIQRDSLLGQCNTDSIPYAPPPYLGGLTVRYTFTAKIQL